MIFNNNQKAFHERFIEENSCEAMFNYNRIISFANDIVLSNKLTNNDKVEIIGYLIEATHIDLKALVQFEPGYIMYKTKMCGDCGNCESNLKFLDKLLSGSTDEMTNRYTDGLFWYDTQTQVKISSVFDFRISVIFELAKIKYKLEQEQ